MPSSPHEPDVDLIKMFGGDCCPLNGKMAFGIYKEFPILRLGPEGAEEALARPHEPMDITGRPMKGWIMVAPEALRGAKLRG